MKKYNNNGFKPSRSLGQNFLADPNIAERIAELSGADETRGVVEIGAGTGVLTAALAKRARKVVSLEIDSRLIPVLTDTLKCYDNIEIIHQDALKANFSAICGERLGGLRPMLCANLPYNITTPLLTAILAPACFEHAAVMIQREVGLWLAAAAGTPEYGAFTLFVQNRADVRIVLNVPPQCFKPAPKVDSAVVVLTRVPLRCANPMFERVVRSAFAQRRKQLINALSAGLCMERGATAEILERCGISPQARGETLTLEQFADIADNL